jgi:protein-S-isoprenylcysteine O-methyltransferase Ste14
MEPLSLARVSLPLLMLSFAGVLLVWPVLRLRRETGVWAVTLHRNTTPGNRLMGLVFLALVLGLSLLVARFAIYGPASIGVWNEALGLVLTGLLLAAAGVLLIAVAQRQMGASFRIGIDDARTALVSQGLFSRVRNPIYSGLLAMLPARPPPCTAAACSRICRLVTVHERGGSHARSSSAGPCSGRSDASEDLPDPQRGVADVREDLRLQLVFRQHHLFQHRREVLVVLFQFRVHFGHSRGDFGRRSRQLLLRQELVDQHVVNEVVDDFGSCFGVIGRRHALQAALDPRFRQWLAIDCRGSRARRRRQTCGRSLSQGRR